MRTYCQDITTYNEIRLEWEEIARAEVSRHRKRLALLSAEQQTEIESALISVAGHILETVLENAERQSGIEALKCMNEWRRPAAA